MTSHSASVLRPLISGRLVLAIAAVTLSCEPQQVAGPSESGPPIALYMGQPEGSSGIDILAASGSFARPPENVTSLPGEYRAMSLSPDGRRVLVTHIRGTPLRRRAVAMDLAGQNVVILSGDTQNAYSPRWSPDGSLVAYTAAGCGSYSVWVARADGSERWRVAGPTHDSTGVAFVQAHGWTPSGDVVYHAIPTGVGSFISAMVVPAEGGEAQPLFGRLGLASPEWSPDGGRVAYVRVDSMDVLQAMEVAAADGSGALEIVPATGELYLQHPSLFANVVRHWSADGQWIAFHRRDVNVVRPDGSGMRPVSPDGGGAIFAGWSADGLVTFDEPLATDPDRYAPHVAAPDGGPVTPLPVGSTFHRNFLWLRPAP